MHAYMKTHERLYERCSGVALIFYERVAVLLHYAVSGNTGFEKVVFLQSR